MGKKWSAADESILSDEYNAKMHCIDYAKMEHGESVEKKRSRNALTIKTDLEKIFVQ